MSTSSTVLQPMSRSLPERGEASEAVTRPGPAPAEAALRQVLAGLRGGAGVRGFQAGIESGQRVLGNRAFLNWVGTIQSGGREVAAEGRLPCSLLAQGPPLQMMGKKKKQQPAQVEAGSGEKAAKAEGGAGAGAQGKATPGPEAALPQAPGAIPGVEPAPVEGVAGGAQKKKKKSRVQVALNTLRGEGVAAFAGYIETEIGEAEALRKLVVRINRAEDLAGVRKEALGVVEGRLRLLDPGGDAVVPEAAAPVQSGREPEQAVIAPVKSVLSVREMALFVACVQGDIRKLRRFARHETVDINMSGEHATLLCHAAYRGHQDIVEELLKHPEIDVNLAQTGAAPPLYLAAARGHVDVVRLLLGARGINVNLATSEGATPLLVAAQSGYEQVVELLLAVQGIGVDLQKSDGATAVYMAVQNGLPRIVEQLVRAGADANLPLATGIAPLSIAARSGNIEIVKQLLKSAGIRVNQADCAGMIPLSIAAQRGHKEIVRLLLRKKADPNIPVEDGITPLHLACLGGYTAIVEMLLHAGADADAGMNIAGDMTLVPYAIAELAGYRQVMSVLAAHLRRREKAPPRPGQLPITEHPDTAGQATALVSPVPSTPSPPDEAAAGPELPTPLARAQDALREEVRSKLQSGSLSSQQGLLLLQEVNAADSLDALCARYDRAAGEPGGAGRILHIA